MKLPLILLGLLIPIVAAAPLAEASYCDGGAYLVRAANHDGRSALLRFDPATGRTRHVARLPAHLNALAAVDGVLYAIARPGPRVMRIDADGTVTSLGRVRGAPRDGFAGAYAGTARGARWTLLHDNKLFNVSIAHQPRVISEVPLSQPIRAGDLAYGPNGNLLTIATVRDRPALIGINPANGRVRVLARPSGLPRGSLYGSIWVLDNELYALHNGTGTIYRIKLDAIHRATPVASGLSTTSTDAAACPAPPPSSPPTPSASPSPAVSPSPSFSSPTPPVPPSPRPNSPSPPAVSPPSPPASPSYPPVSFPASPPAPGVSLPVSSLPPPVSSSLGPAMPAPPALALPGRPAQPPAPVGQPAAVPPPPAPPLTAPKPAPYVPPRPAAAIADSDHRTRTRRYVAAGIVALTMACLLGLRSRPSAQ